ncbi:MAG TPA: DNA repair protein RecN, partial [Clostridia bacterium]|nr:DNA repair protein RecN [Clostridia bacterium]
MIAYRDRIAEQLDQAMEDDSRSEKLAERLKQERLAYLEAAEALTKARGELAERFSERMLDQLKDLGMQSARFSVAMERREDGFHEDGLDQVEFMIAPNPGEPLRPLARIASGGETSRLMLAIKSIAADSAGVPVVIFDEIDTGISGRMAQVVAEKMADIARKRQVLCVTHLPQIAAMADVPYRVVKTTDGQSTRTQLERLDTQEQLKELARMMGGANAESESSLRHAASLWSEANAWKARVIGREG